MSSASTHTEAAHQTSGIANKTPLDLAASASELAAANAASLRRRVLGVAAAELRALPAGRVSER